MGRKWNKSLTFRTNERGFSGDGSLLFEGAAKREIVVLSDERRFAAGDEGGEGQGELAVV